jgi:hypothetical protein
LPLPSPLPETLTAWQRDVVSYPRQGGGSLFLRGWPGTGKSTALLARLAALLREGRRPHEILVLLPQRAQVERYEALLKRLDAPTRGGVELATFYSLSRRAVALFWPLVAAAAGFRHPEREPIFLTIETAQYFLWRIVEPLITQQGYFRDLAIRRGRLLSQLLDNLNKSALVGFDHTDIYARLRGAWTGSVEGLNRFWQAQDCALRFREYCLEHNLLDFSLVTEVFSRYLLPHEVYQRYFRARYRHLLVDNVEENVPVAHAFLAWALEQCQSSVLAYDENGGYRLFLGADAQGALEVGRRCRDQWTCATLLQPTADALALAHRVSRALGVEGAPPPGQGQALRAIAGQSDPQHKFWISMITWVAERVTELVQGGTPPGEIAIIAPYVNDVMRFAIAEQLAARNIPTRLLRPATPLRDDPVLRALLILVWLAHPHWQLTLQGEAQTLAVDDVALALHVALADLDPIRARHLAQRALPPSGPPILADLSGAAPGQAAQEVGRLWERVGYQVRERYETLRVWLETYRQGESLPVDLFLSRLFGELLSRPGYGFHDDLARARAYGRLVESAFKFREAVGPEDLVPSEEVAREYVQLLWGGIASAEYLLDRPQPEEGVILAPAYAYLTRDLRSAYQFWIDLGSDGWWHRPNQPLTHPYVLSARWPLGQPWRDVEEDRANREALARVILGLAARCTRGIFLGYSELGLDGQEQNGRLQRALMLALTRAGREGGGSDGG